MGYLLNKIKINYIHLLYLVHVISAYKLLMIEMFVRLSIYYELKQPKHLYKKNPLMEGA